MGAIGMVLALQVLRGTPAPTKADSPEPHRGDLVVQFGQLILGCDDGCTAAGDPSDRIDFLSPANGTTITSWESGYLGAQGLDVSNGDGVLLPIDPDYYAGVNYYAVRLAGSDGSLIERWGVSSPAQIWPNGIAAAPEDNDPLVSEGNIYEATGMTSADELEVPLENVGATLIGATASTVAYGTGGQLPGEQGRIFRLVDRFDGDLISEIAAPPEYRDAHLSPDGSGVIVAPGQDGIAEYMPFSGGHRAASYQVPTGENGECGAVSADASGDHLYVLASCESADAVIYAFNLVTGDYMGVIKTYTAAELALVGSFPVRLRVYGSANPASKAVIYVHGANENAHNIEDFDATLELANIKDSPNSHLIEFFYQQDKGCTAEPTPYIAMPTTDTSTGIHVDSHFSSDDRCPSYTGHRDSQSSISET